MKKRPLKQIYHISLATFYPLEVVSNLNEVFHAAPEILPVYFHSDNFSIIRVQDSVRRREFYFHADQVVLPSLNSDGASVDFSSEK